MSSRWDFGSRTSIVGIGQSPFSRSSGRTTLSLAVEAAHNAMLDAGMGPSDIDGIVRCEIDRVSYNDLAHVLGLERLTYFGAAGPGGGAQAAMIAQAVGAVVSGQAKAVLVYRSMNGRSGARFGHGRVPVSAQVVGGDGSYDEYFTPFGLTTPGQMWAMIARRHMHEFGTTEEQFGAVALACRRHANANPAAQLHARPLSMAEYLSARMISTPLRLYDFCLETDGAQAVIVTSTDHALDTPHGGAVIRAVALGLGYRHQGGVTLPALMRDSLTSQPSSIVAEVLYRRAGLGPADIDVAQLYDCYTPTVIMQLEDYGFCPRGEGGPFAASGALELGGSLPVNTSGGGLSEGYLQGFNIIVEGVRQMRGTSTAQVAGAEICLVTSGLPVASSALVLTRQEV